MAYNRCVNVGFEADPAEVGVALLAVDMVAGCIYINMYMYVYIHVHVHIYIHIYI